MYSNSDAGAILGLLVFWLAIFPILAIIGYVVSALFIRKLLVLAGAQNPNLAWIPVFNGMLWAKLVDLNPWVYLIIAAGSGILSGIPVLGWIIALLPAAMFILMVLRTNQKLGKEPVGWTIFGVLLAFIWMIVLLAQGGQQWRTGPQAVAAPFWHKWGSFFHDTTTWAGLPNQGYPVPQGPAAPPQAPPPATPPQTPPPAV